MTTTPPPEPDHDERAMQDEAAADRRDDERWADYYEGFAEIRNHADDLPHSWDA